jgi:hypothetical protein
MGTGVRPGAKMTAMVNGKKVVANTPAARNKLVSQKIDLMQKRMGAK